MTATALSRIRHAVSAHLALTAAIGVGYDLMKTNTAVNSSFNGGGSLFSTNGIQPARIRTTLGAGLSYEGNNKVTITGRYDADFSRGATSQQVSLRIMKAF